MSIQQLRNFLRHGPLRLQHVLLDQIIVVDHLGSNIPVPTMFCSKLDVSDYLPFYLEVSCITCRHLQNLRYVIRGYCKGRVGIKQIEEGDFHLLRSDDCQLVHPDNLTDVVQSGVALEMTIVLREIYHFWGHPGTCPRCGYVNLHSSPYMRDSGVEW